MKIIDNWKLKVKILFIVLVLMSLTISMGVYSIMKNESIGDAISKIVDEDMALSKSLNEINIHQMELAHLSERAMRFGSQKRYKELNDTIKEYKQVMEKIDNEIKTALNIAQVGLKKAKTKQETQEHNKILEEINSIVKKHESTETDFNKILEFLLSGDIKKAEKASIKYDADEEAVFEGISKFQKKIDEVIQKQVLQTDQDQHKIANMMIVLLIIFLVFGISISLLISSKISNSIKMIIEFLQKLSKGDISESIESSSTDEIGQMINALSEMAKQMKYKAGLLEKVAGGDLSLEIKLASDQDSLGNSLLKMKNSLNLAMSTVDEAVKNIFSGSEELSKSSQQVSQGTTEQAGSIEEISSSITELASQTKQASENAEGAKKIADNTQKNSADGSLIMKELVSAMADINSSSENIAKIIKTIEEIAFQTNLLALNAAVEAARAGRHGKGFAVVAEEVNKLSKKSTKAAKETAGIIEASIKKIEHGSSLLDKTEKIFQEINSGISEVNKMVTFISQASKEQVQGIKQVEEGIHQIDLVIQQNASVSEENAASSEELSGQASQLREIVSQFQLDENNRDGLKKVEIVKRKVISDERLDSGSRKTIEAKPKGKVIKPEDVISLKTGEEDYKNF